MKVAEMALRLAGVATEKVIIVDSDCTYCFEWSNCGYGCLLVTTFFLTTVTLLYGGSKIGHGDIIRSKVHFMNKFPK